jgi:hypothetical protein
MVDIKWPPPCLGDANKPRVSEMKLALGGRTAVSGIVRVKGDGGLRYLTITLFASGSSEVIARTITGGNGEFRIEDLKPGTYDIAVSTGADLFLFEETVANVRKVRLREGHDLEINLTWQPLAPRRLCI